MWSVLIRQRGWHKHDYLHTKAMKTATIEQHWGTVQGRLYFLLLLSLVLCLDCNYCSEVWRLHHRDVSNCTPHFDDVTTMAAVAETLHEDVPHWLWGPCSHCGCMFRNSYLMKRKLNSTQIELSIFLESILTDELKFRLLLFEYRYWQLYVFYKGYILTSASLIL